MRQRHLNKPACLLPRFPVRFRGAACIIDFAHDNRNHFEALMPSFSDLLAGLHACKSLLGPAALQVLFCKLTPDQRALYGMYVDSPEVRMICRDRRDTKTFVVSPLHRELFNPRRPVCYACGGLWPTCG